jgi:hypothetical protein
LSTTLFNQDDWHLLSHAMASDFAVTWQFSKREQSVIPQSFVQDQLGDLRPQNDEGEPDGRHLAGRHPERHRPRASVG